MTAPLRLIGFLLTLATTTVIGQKPTNVTDGELAILPAYCNDVMGIRYGDQYSNTSPRASYWVSKMGNGFWSMHGYCWARINLGRIKAKTTDPARRNLQLESVVGNLTAVILTTKPDFIMLPEVYSMLAEVELMRGNVAAAFNHADAAIKLKPSYSHPYEVWGAYLFSRGQKKEAKEFVAAGLKFNPSAPILRDLYVKLGGDLRGFALTPEKPASVAATNSATAPPVTPSTASQAQ